MRAGVKELTLRLQRIALPQEGGQSRPLRTFWLPVGGGIALNHNSLKTVVENLLKRATMLRKMMLTLAVTASLAGCATSDERDSEVVGGAQGGAGGVLFGAGPGGAVETGTTTGHLKGRAP